LTMSTEPLSDMLQVLGAKSVLTGALIAGGAWSICLPPPERIKFRGVVKGSCWLRMGDDATVIQLQTGDVLLILRSAPLTVSSGHPACDVYHALFRVRPGGSLIHRFDLLMRNVGRK
jgi:Cupin